jgi:hypothetical protein
LAELTVFPWREIEIETIIEAEAFNPLGMFRLTR